MGVEGTPNKSQHTKLTLKKKILLPLLPGFKLATFRSLVRHSDQQAISAPSLSKHMMTYKENLRNHMHLAGFHMALSHHTSCWDIFLFTYLTLVTFLNQVNAYLLCRHLHFQDWFPTDFSKTFTVKLRSATISILSFKLHQLPTPPCTTYQLFQSPFDRLTLSVWLPSILHTNPALVVHG